jgi:hypothetical protein
MALSHLMKDQRPGRKEHLDVALPLPAGAKLQLTTKTAGVNDFVRGVSSQLPNIRLPDTLVGGGLGAAAGLGYDALQDDKGANPAERSRRKWSRILSGAGMGALGSNVAGDRFRRYVSNKLYPLGYDSNRAGIAPKNFKEVWDGAVLDKPLQPEVQAYNRGQTEGPWESSSTASSSGTTDRNIVARRELMRRAFGVHSENPKKDIWLTQPDGSVSLNPKHQDAENFVKEFFYPSPKADDIDGATYARNLMTDPSLHAANINSSTAPQSMGMMSPITGGQRVALYPYKNIRGGNTYEDYLAKITDRWDVGLDSEENSNLMKYVKGKYLKRDPNASLAPRSNTYSTSDHLDNQKVTSDTLSSYLKRMFYDKVLAKESPWISQRLYMNRLPDNPAGNSPYGPGYAAIPSTATGHVYPGNTVATFVDSDNVPHNQDQPYMDFHDPRQLLPKLQQNQYVAPTPPPPPPRR